MLLGDGYTPRQILRMGEEGRLRRVGHGVYLLEGAPDTPRTRLVAGLVAVGAPVAVTDRTALWVAGHLAEAPARPDLLVPHPRRARNTAGARVRRSSTFEHAGVRRIGDIPVVDRHWAACDVARFEPRPGLAAMLTQGLREHWLSLAKLRRTNDSRAPYPGAARMNRTLTAMERDLPYSGTEQRLARGVRRRGLDVVLNLEVRDRRGHLIRVADLAVPAQRLDIEVDGPWHWLPDSISYDRQQDRLMQGQDWSVLRLSCYEIDEDVDLAADEVLRHATQLGGRSAA